MNAMSALERFLLRLALRGRLPFARKFLAWHTQCFITATEPSSALYTEFMIPDPERPIPEEPPVTAPVQAKQELTKGNNY